MRRSCERPGCTEPVAVIYGFAGDGDAMHIWLDGWKDSDDEQSLPPGVSGIVCRRHGSLLSPPRGWDLIDRREVVPRLFVPRPILVHSRPAIVPSEPTTPSTTGPRDVDSSAARRRRRVNDLPAPQLFSELRVDDEAPRVTDSFEPTAGSHGSDIESTIVDTNGDGACRDDESHDNEPLDDGLSALLDATGPLLRRAFGKRNTGRHDASKELMRPTTQHIVDESA